ncbi:MAG: aldo/keto reductase [Waterburya sp.]
MKKQEQVKKTKAKLIMKYRHLALAWLLAQGEDIIPIPGRKKRDRVTENAQAVEI